MTNRILYACFTSFALLSLPPALWADNPHVCIQLTPASVGSPAVRLEVFASNLPGSVSSIFSLNGTGLSVQGSTNPPLELSYLLSGTAVVTAKGVIEASLAGTALDATCGCTKESVFHLVIDGQNDSYQQIIRTPGAPDAVLTGAAAFVPSCG